MAAKFHRSMADHASLTGTPWGTLGKDVEKVRPGHMVNMGNIWRIYGESMDNLWIIYNDLVGG